MVLLFLLRKVHTFDHTNPAHCGIDAQIELRLHEQINLQAINIEIAIGNSINALPALRSLKQILGGIMQQLPQESVIFFAVSFRVLNKH